MLATPATTQTATHARELPSSPSSERTDEGDDDGPLVERREPAPREDRGVEGNDDGDDTNVVSCPGGGASPRSGVEGGDGTRSATETIGVTSRPSVSAFASVGASRKPEVMDRRVLGPSSGEGSGIAFSSSGMAQAKSASATREVRA